MEIQAPNPFSGIHDKFLVFIGGSIDMGTAPDWQREFARRYQDSKFVCILNPRRDDFDPMMEQSIDNPPFYEQVTWELDALMNADVVVFVFDAVGKAPITLLELGLAAKSDVPVAVVCPPGYWRKGNVDIVCEHFGIDMFNTVEEVYAWIDDIVGGLDS